MYLHLISNRSRDISVQSRRYGKSRDFLTAKLHVNSTDVDNLFEYFYIEWDEITEFSSGSEHEDAESDVEVDYEINRQLCIGKICVAMRQAKEIGTKTLKAIFSASRF